MTAADDVVDRCHTGASIMFALWAQKETALASPSRRLAPGAAPSGTPDMPKTSSSKLSLPFIAAGTLKQESASRRPHKMHICADFYSRLQEREQVDVRLCALVKDESVHLMAVHAQAAHAGQLPVAC